jgi:hypothetical protein
VRWIPASLALFALGACGGGGSSSTVAPTQPSQPSATPVSSEGVITGFGSVYVNDVRYELDDDTQVVSDDEQRVGDDSILRLGMKVSIDATESDGRRVAERIEHRRDVKGPVTRLMSDPDDPSTGTFYVANTRIITDANTVYGSGFDDRDGNGEIDIRDLTVDNGRLVVAVSGFAAEDGYLASRISRVSGNDDDDDELELKGFVTAVDLDASTFTVSGTTFAVTGATEFEDGLVFDASLEGEFVEVEGVLVDGTFEAREVEREDDDDDDRSGRFEIEGILVSVDLDSDPDLIQIGSRTIEVTDASALVDLVGSKVKIKGTFDDAGVLVIDTIRSREEDERVRTEDRVMSVDAAGGTFTTRLGLVIRPEPTTRLEDDDHDDDDRISPEDFLNRLRSNDYVEARGALQDDGSVRWTKIEREDEDDDDEECKLRGPVETIAADQTSFDILGVTIDVASGREVEFEDDDDDIGRAEFFRRLAVGSLVEAESDDDDVNACQNGLMLAEEVELDDDQRPFPPPGGNDGDNGSGDPGNGSGTAAAVFLIIDEDSIDNGNPPNDFSETDVNDQLAAVGQREPLAFFQANVGSQIDLFTGQVGDEGWFALKTVPSTWQEAGPTDNGTRNYLLAGPGLGGDSDDPEVLLDEIPDVTPLRATGLAMLQGETVCAVVYDSDVSINYSPLTGNLQGANLGIVGFEVVSAAERTDGSDSDLPRVTIEIRDAAVCEETLFLFTNAPVPESSSEPFDVTPPTAPPAPSFVPAP